MVRVVGVGDWLWWLRITVRVDSERPACSCGGTVHRHGVREALLVELPCFGRPTRLGWRKQHWRRARPLLVRRGPGDRDDPLRVDDQSRQVGRHGRAVSDVAAELGRGWHAVMEAVVAIGEQLVDHPDRIGSFTALGLVEALFARVGRFRRQLWSTQIVDVRRGQLLDVVPGRDSVEPCSWLAGRGPAWLAAIEWTTLDLSAAYRCVFDTMLPDAVQVADPFHVVEPANQMLDECRRRVQNETLAHRGRRADPLWRARRRLTIARERLSDEQHGRVLGLLRASDPHREVRSAWNAKEVVRKIYDHSDHEVAVEWVADLGLDFTDPEMPVEVQRLGRTINKWAGQITAWLLSHVTNGPTEAVNNPAKRIKRVAFGIINFRHHRVRCLLYAGKPDWTLLPTIQP